MDDLLTRMARASASRAARARKQESESALRRRALDTPSPTPLVLQERGFDLIAEIKRRSPSAGRLEDDDDLTATARTLQRARAYVAAGAAAISLLTEPVEFGGRLSDVTLVAREVAVPVMRKDFMVDPYQLLEARAAGASGALVIVRLVNEARLLELLAAANEMGLFVLLEAFEAEEIDHAAAILREREPGDAPILLGLNCRDLETLIVDPERFEQLRSRFPEGAIAVAESGLGTPADVAKVSRAGYSVALVGGALMLSADPHALAAKMIEAGRAEVGR